MELRLVLCCCILGAILKIAGTLSNLHFCMLMLWQNETENFDPCNLISYAFLFIQ